MIDDTKITPWEVTSTTGIDYLKLIKHFGCQPIDGALVRRFEQVTKTKAHPWLRRGIFFSHKDLDIALNAFEKGEEIYLYTGRGPQLRIAPPGAYGSLHVHQIPPGRLKRHRYHSAHR